jgi:predicted RNA-binding Zn ribbon-like protein
VRDRYATPLGAQTALGLELHAIAARLDASDTSVRRRILLADLRAVAAQLDAWSDETRLRQCGECSWWFIIDDRDRRTARRRWCRASCRRRAHQRQRRLPLDVEDPAPWPADGVASDQP